MSNVIEQMLNNYNLKQINKINVVKEIMQEIVLCGLSRAGFFKEAAFYGGTALRIFYGLDRFSEDLDFSLKVKDNDFDLTKFFPILEKEIASFGLKVEIVEKIKTIDSKVHSAFLKGNTIEHLFIFYGEQKFLGVHSEQKIKIKFEVDTDPPSNASYQHQYRLLPSPYEVMLYDAPSLFAGKIHAILCRNWKNRIKGRDLYDYIFFITRNIPVNLAHLKSRLKQSGDLNAENEFTLIELKNRLSKHFENVDYNVAKEDVKPFLRSHDSLQVWNVNFFKQITEKITAI